MSNRSTDPSDGAVIAVRIASFLAILVLWWLAALRVSDPQTLPAPAHVAGAIWRELIQGELLPHLMATLGRVIAAFAVAMSIGLMLGLWMGRSRGANLWLDNLLIIMLNLPALVTIVLCYLWLGLTEVAAVTAVALNKIPMVTVMMREGARALDPRLDDMTRIFTPPRRVALRHVVLPQLAPHLASAGRAGLAVIWKIVLVVEFLGRPNGVGFQIHLGFQLFDVTMVLVYALSFVVIMLAVEALILRPWERHANRWRQP
ncbi:ABC transporter permease [Actibacterium atlanticum]|uniref:ABC transporter permease n=1 Tax=Actibacterium atlanticum TaxID=1461693 RepID=A0A058ZQ20_9RHOB|nr:ABC transporter permease [Actibacterium atlanticum]KCV83335.1 ABC transporter permease [Actibacterium atlanticum]